MVVYLIWLCICLGLVIIGLLIDRTWLNKKIKEQKNEIEIAYEKVGRYNNRCFDLSQKLAINSDLLDQYILRDFEREEKKMIVKKKKK